MSKEVKFLIGEAPYRILFGYGAIRLIGQKLGTKGYNETIQKVGAAITSLAPKEGEDQTPDIPFEVMDSLVVVIHSGIQNADADQVLPEENELVDALLQDTDILTEVIQAFMASMPQPKGSPEPKQKAAGKRTPRKK